MALKTTDTKYKPQNSDIFIGSERTKCAVVETLQDDQHVLKYCEQ